MWLLTKIKNKQKLKETGDTRYIYCNELDKPCFHDDMADGAYKDMPRRTACDKVLCDKVFAFSSNPQYDGCHYGMVSMVYKFFDDKFRDYTNHAGTGATLEANQRIYEYQQLANELHRPITRKFSILTIMRKYLRY